MKQDWKFKKLGDVCTVVGGSTPKTNIPEYWGGENYWVTPAELTGEKYIESTERTITDEAVAKTNLTLLPVGTVLLSSRAPIGKVCITRSLMYCNQGFKNIVCSKCLYNEYVYWWLKGKTDYLNSLGVGATFKEISKRTVEQIVIPVPPLSEQSRIVAELDLLTGIIDKQNAQLNELDTLAQSIFYDMFGDPIENEKGWNVKKLGDVCSLITDGVHAKPVYVQEGIPFISVKDITTGKLVFDDVKYVSVSDHVTMSKRCPVAKGDILYTKVGATYGRPALVDTDREFSLYVSVALLKPKQDLVNNVFLCHQMATDFVKHQADKSIKGIGVPDLHLNMIRNFHILIPPKSLQLVFNSKIASIENQKAKIKATIADTQKLLDYTMDKYFG